MRAAVLALTEPLFAPVAMIAAEPPYCAFEVKVTTKSGAPRSRVPVVLIRGHSNTFLETQTDTNGLAKLCDTPLEAVDIAVGFDVCGLVTVRNLHPLWPETKRVFVTFEENPCNHFVFPEYCQVLLRVQDPEGRPVGGVRFSGSLAERGSESGVSDELGRIYLMVKRGGRLEGAVTGTRRREAPISARVTDDVEIKVVLHE